MGEYKASQPMSAPHPNNDCVFCAGTGWVHVDDGTAVTADELEGENW